MDELEFGLPFDESFYDDSRPMVGFGWLDVTTRESGKPSRVRFWADRTKMHAFASAVAEKSARSEFPIEVQWDDEEESRAFHLTIAGSTTSHDLSVELQIKRGETDRCLSCSFATSPKHLQAFNSAMADLLTQRRSKAVLRGW